MYNENQPMTVFAQPTRGYPTDGKTGRVSKHFYSAAKETSPGWDGCRDRLDGYLDERGPKYNLELVATIATFGTYRAVGYKHRLLLIYGGSAFQEYKPNPYESELMVTQKDNDEAGYGFRAGKSFGFDYRQICGRGIWIIVHKLFISWCFCVYERLLSR